MPSDRPVIVCLCGSPAFQDAFYKASWEESLAGRIVLAPLWSMPTPKDVELAAMLEELHLRKIDLADEVLFLNVGGFMPTEVHRQLLHALSNGKTVRFWNREEGERYLKEIRFP